MEKTDTLEEDKLEASLDFREKEAERKVEGRKKRESTWKMIEEDSRRS